MRARFLLLLMLTAVSPHGVFAQDESAEAVAMKRIESWGGGVVRDDKRPDAPTIRIGFDQWKSFSVVGIPGLFEVENLHPNPMITDAALKELSELEGLPVVSFFSFAHCPAITDAGVRHIAQFKDLRALVLGGCTLITDSGIAELKTLKNLEHLDLAQTQLTGAGLRELAELENLTELQISQCRRLADADMQELGQLTNLTQLRLGRTEITDAGVHELRNLTKLKLLDLNSNDRITDVGLMELRGLKTLKSMHLMACPQITNLGVKVLKKSLPHVEVVRY